MPGLWKSQVVLIALLLGFVTTGGWAGGYEKSKEGIYEAIVLTEAAGEPFEGKLAVAEVLRNREWRTEGFAGLLRHNLPAFLAKNRTPEMDRECRLAVRRVLAGSNLSGGATHFENVEAFGWPKWARGMRVTAKIGRHTFLK